MVLSWIWFLGLSMGASALFYCFDFFDGEFFSEHVGILGLVAMLFGAWAGWPIIFEPLHETLIAWLPQPGSQIQQVTAGALVFACVVVWLTAVVATTFVLRVAWIRFVAMRDARRSDLNELCEVAEEGSDK